MRKKLQGNTHLKVLVEAILTVTLEPGAGVPKTARLFPPVPEAALAPCGEPLLPFELGPRHDPGA